MNYCLLNDKLNNQWQEIRIVNYINVTRTSLNDKLNN